MGDRAVIGVTHPTSKTPIFLYTHWRGAEICQVLAEGLESASAMGRLTDYEYATRIVFDTLTSCSGGATGFGICIGSHPADVQYDIPHITWGDRGQPTIAYQGQVVSVGDFVSRFTRNTAGLGA